MSVVKTPFAAVLGQRLRCLREFRGWSQEKVGVEIGLDESSARTRISRYELGVHEPPIATARSLARVLDVPLAYLYCDDDQIAKLLFALYKATPNDRHNIINNILMDLGYSQSSH